MSKQSLIIIAIIIIIIASGIYFRQKTNQESQSAAPTIKEEKNYLLYSNQVQGYTLEIPKRWEGKFETRENEKLTSFIYSAVPEFKAPIFTIWVYSKSDWETMKSQSYYQGTEITEVNDKVFVFTIPLENLYEPYGRESAGEFQTMVDNVKEIIKTFKYVSPATRLPASTSP